MSSTRFTLAAGVSPDILTRPRYGELTLINSLPDGSTEYELAHASPEEEGVQTYPYPKEKHDVAARLMILRNTMHEFDMVIGRSYNTGSGLSLTEMEKQSEALAALLDQPDLSETSQRNAQRMLAVLRLKTGAERTISFYERLQAGEGKDKLEPLFRTATEELYHAVTLARDSHFRIAEQPDSDRDYNYVARTAGTVREILQTSDFSISHHIDAWYQHIASVKKHLRLRGAELLGMVREHQLPEECGAKAAEFTEACRNMANARRNEPEYAVTMHATVTALDELRKMTDQSGAQPELIALCNHMFVCAQSRGLIGREKTPATPTASR